LDLNFWGFFMAKYSEQYKLQIVEQYLAGGIGTKALADNNGIGRSVVERWVRLYRLHGLDGLKKKFTHYSAEFKLSVLRHMWDNELSCNQAAAVFNIRHPAAVGTWECKHREGGIEALRPRPRGRPTMPTPAAKKPSPTSGKARTREEELQAENAQLRMEVAYLKKLHALVQAQEKLAQAKKHK
jgi:transposase